MVSTQILLQWGATLSAALSVIALKALQGKASAVQSSPAHHRLTLQARRIWSRPLPPTPFWRWLCGSMNVLDSCLVLFWLTLQLTWVIASVQRKLPNLRAAVDRGYTHRTYRAEVFLATAQSFGWAASTDLLLLFYPVPRNTFLHWLFNTDFPGLVKYHRWLGNGTIAMVTIHGVMYYTYWVSTHQWVGQAFAWNHQGVNRLAGSLAWLAGLLLQLTATQYVRRRWYTVFYTTHILGFICFMLFAFIHFQSMWAYTLSGFVLYLMDVTFRVAQRMHWTTASSASKTSDDGTLATLSLRWSQAAELVPSQILWMNIPSLSQLHWHPVSIAHVDLDEPRSPDSDGLVTVVFKAYGEWTKGLIGQLAKGELPVVRASGPFGCPQGPKWAAHQVLVIFAGGIGITPMLGMLRHMATFARGKKSNPHTAAGIPDKVYLIWSSRSSSELQLLDQELIDLARQDEAWLSIQLHCTAQHGADTQSQSAESGLAKMHEGSGLLEGADGYRGPLADKASSSAPGSLQKTGLLHHVRDLQPGALGSAGSSQQVQPAQPRALVSYGFGNLHWAVAHVLSMAGSFGAGVAIYGFRASTDGVPGWQIGSLLFFVTCLATAGTASLVILPVHLYRYWREGQKTQPQGVALQSDYQSVPSESVQLLDNSMSHLEAQDNIEVTHSRPDACSELRRVMAAHSQTPEISVFVAGPQALYADIKDICAGINKGRAQQGKPFLSVHRQAYNL